MLQNFVFRVFLSRKIRAILSPDMIQFGPQTGDRSRYEFVVHERNATSLLAALRNRSLPMQFFALQEIENKSPNLWSDITANQGKSVVH
jgi:hypothetical protein